MIYNSESMLIKPAAHGELIMHITPQSAGWDFISFQARRLQTGASWAFDSGENELALINFTGVYRVQSNHGAFVFGGRETVFSGGAHALYLPRRTQFTITAERGGEFACAWSPTDRDTQPWLITPETVKRSVRGGDNVSRQINDLLPPGSPVHRLVLVEVYTPSGNWSSFPPHKHDVHLTGPDGALLESDLEEIYFFKTDRPEGYAYQRVYTDPGSPLHAAGHPIDAVMIAGDNCAVLVPEGYHPVTAAPGTNAYCLNVLAGSAQSLANREDPAFAWVKTAYRGADSRLPLY